LAALTQLLHEVLQTWHAVTVLVLCALTEQSLEGAKEVTFFEKVIAHSVEQRLGVEIQDVLAAVPRAIPKDR